jgi:hypothetical protein
VPLAAKTFAMTFSRLLGLVNVLLVLRLGSTLRTALTSQPSSRQTGRAMGAPRRTVLKTAAAPSEKSFAGSQSVDVEAQDRPARAPQPVHLMPRFDAAPPIRSLTHHRSSASVDVASIASTADSHAALIGGRASPPPRKHRPTLSIDTLGRNIRPAGELSRQLDAPMPATLRVPHQRQASAASSMSLGLPPPRRMGPSPIAPRPRSPDSMMTSLTGALTPQAHCFPEVVLQQSPVEDKNVALERQPSVPRRVSRTEALRQSLASRRPSLSAFGLSRVLSKRG